MDAPKCQNFPSCGKRHFGPCGSGATGARPGAAQARSSGPKKKSSAKKKLKPDNSNLAEVIDQDIHYQLRQGPRLHPSAALIVQYVDPTYEARLEDRIFNLERLVDELLAGKRKRSKYMREYQRERRKKDD